MAVAAVTYERSNPLKTPEPNESKKDPAHEGPVSQRGWKYRTLFNPLNASSISGEQQESSAVLSSSPSRLSGSNLYNGPISPGFLAPGRLHTEKPRSQPRRSAQISKVLVEDHPDRRRMLDETYRAGLLSKRANNLPGMVPGVRVPWDIRYGELAWQHVEELPKDYRAIQPGDDSVGAAASILLSTVELLSANNKGTRLPLTGLSLAASPNLGGTVNALDYLNLLGNLHFVSPYIDSISSLMSFSSRNSLHHLPELIPGNVLPLSSWVEDRNQPLRYYEVTLDPRSDLAVVRKKQGWLRKALSIGLALAAGLAVVFVPATFVLTIPALSLSQSLIDYRVVRIPRGAKVPTEWSPEEMCKHAIRYGWALVR